MTTQDGIKPVIHNITIYPVKSLDGISLQTAQVVKGGCLRHDREYAIVYAEGDFVNGKSNALVHTLRSEVDLQQERISFRHEPEQAWNSFHLQDEANRINDYLSGIFHTPVSLIKNSEGRFMDIPDKAGLTILSDASLQTVSGWFNNMNLEETRQRFRATIEISGVPAFWEDRLFAEQDVMVEFMAGDVRLYGVSPRARCVVPTRHPRTGQVIHAFPKTFAKHRATDLPSWSMLEAYGHHYYLTVNCYIPPTQVDKWISVGDEIHLTGNVHPNIFKDSDW